MTDPQRHTLFVVADNARARFITFEPVPRECRTPTLRPVEHEDLLHPDGRTRDRELYTDQPGRSRAVRVGPGSDYGDHREARDDDQSRRFAREVADAIERRAVLQGAEAVVVAATPRMLGLLRPLAARLARFGIAWSDLPKDLSGWSAERIQAHLAGRRLLPSEVEEPAPTSAG